LRTNPSGLGLAPENATGLNSTHREARTEN
jgi:hypothetical protein